MKIQPTISLKQVCEYFHFNYDVAQDFVTFGMVPAIVFKKRKDLGERNSEKTDNAVKLCEALGINNESIGVILAMRGKMSGLEDEIETLQSEVARFRQWQESQEYAKLEELGCTDDPLAAKRRTLLVEALK
jgi:hypothetical protein